MKKSGFLSPITLLPVLLVIIGVSVLSSCYSPYRYGSNGERIYFTATSSSGQPITYTGSIRMMHTITCANCHGQDGKGGRVHMMMWNFNEEEHEEHPLYTEKTLKLAITKGLNTAGEPLDEEMPRWYMSEPDLDDLVGFMKTLD